MEHTYVLDRGQKRRKTNWIISQFLAKVLGMRSLSLNTHRWLQKYFQIFAVMDVLANPKKITKKISPFLNRTSSIL